MGHYFPKFEKEIMTEGPRGLMSSHFTSQYLLGERVQGVERESQNTQEHIGTISGGIKDKHVCKNNINFNRMQLGWRSAVNSGPVDSCCYLEPDVVILGLDPGRSIMRWREQRDDGSEEIKSDIKLKPGILILMRLEWHVTLNI